MNDAVKAAHAHTNLNIMAAVVAILTGGCIYPTNHSVHATVLKIVKLCESEQRRQLSIYDSNSRQS